MIISNWKTLLVSITYTNILALLVCWVVEQWNLHYFSSTSSICLSLSWLALLIQDIGSLSVIACSGFVTFFPWLPHVNPSRFFSVGALTNGVFMAVICYFSGPTFSCFPLAWHISRSSHTLSPAPITIKLLLGASRTLHQLNTTIVVFNPFFSRSNHSYNGNEIRI